MNSSIAMNMKSINSTGVPEEYREAQFKDDVAGCRETRSTSKARMLGWYNKLIAALRFLLLIINLFLFLQQHRLIHWSRTTLMRMIGMLYSKLEQILM